MSLAAFIADQRTSHHVPHAVACRALTVSESWFYKWNSRQQQREPTPADNVEQSSTRPLLSRSRPPMACAVRRVFTLIYGLRGGW